MTSVKLSIVSVRAVAAVVAAAALVSCADDAQVSEQETVTVTSTQQVPVEADPSTDADPVTESDPGTVAEQPSESEVADPQPPVTGAYASAGGPIPPGATPIVTMKQGYAVIQTPSGNIGCDITGQELGCRISSYLEDAPYGRVPGGPRSWVTISDDQTGIHHHGGVNMFMPLGPNDTLPTQTVDYGQVVYHGKYVCASEFHGLTCWDSNNGRGAFMSRERTEFF